MSPIQMRWWKRRSELVIVSKQAQIGSDKKF